LTYFYFTKNVCNVKFYIFVYIVAQDVVLYVRREHRHKLLIHYLLRLLLHCPGGMGDDVYPGIGRGAGLLRPGLGSHLHFGQYLWV
jgi:hypothetical protein